MKQMRLYERAIFLALLILCAGCSTTKPAPDETAAAASPADQRQTAAAHPGRTTKFVNAWLKGDAPPPDFSMGGGDGNSGWTFLGMILQCAGTLLVNK